MLGDLVNKEYMISEVCVAACEVVAQHDTHIPLFFFLMQIKYSSLADTIRGTGVLISIDACLALDQLLGMAFECGPQQGSLLQYV